MDIVDRLYEQLVLAIRRTPFGTAERALTIGDIYQHLIPYRSVRSELGIWELPQYEHALLRLLSGERGYATLAAAEVQEELRRELAAPNPILGIYRDYPAVEVRLGVPDVAPRLPPRSPPAAVEEASPVVDLPRLTVAAVCRTCQAALPDVPGLRFCPDCGADQVELPCSGCGTVLKAEWNFCIRCGTPRDGGAGRQRA